MNGIMEKNEVPLYEKIPSKKNKDILEYAYYTSSGDRVIRYSEEYKDNIFIYKDAYNRILSLDLVKLLENKDSIINLSDCIERQSIELELNAPNSYNSAEEYCNKDKSINYQKILTKMSFHGLYQENKILQIKYKMKKKMIVLILCIIIVLN